MPKNSAVRPTTDKLRSALFSILGKRIEGASVLDGFAGSGAFGIEAYSRGARYVVFVDIDVTAVRVNTDLIPKGSYSVIKSDFCASLTNLSGTFDIIFLDPPYDKIDPTAVLSSLAASGRLGRDGIVIYEESVRTSFPVIAGYDVSDKRRYGDTAIRFLEKSL